MSLRLFLSLLTSCALLVGCDDDAPTSAPSAPPVSAAPPAVQGRDFDLAGGAALLHDGTVRDGRSLERALNRNPNNRVDIDRNGRPDPLQVVERREGTKIFFDVRAIPYGERSRNVDAVAVPIAVYEIAPNGQFANVTVRYADVVVAPAPPVIFVVPATQPFFVWVLDVSRPIYIGTYYVHVDVRVRGRGKWKHHGR